MNCVVIFVDVKLKKNSFPRINLRIDRKCEDLARTSPPGAVGLIVIGVPLSWISWAFKGGTGLRQ